jgi:hypothetical protein
MANQLITLKCPVHPVSGKSSVCTQCYSSLDEEKIRLDYAVKHLRKEVSTLQQALKDVPGVVDGLFEEGMLYKGILLRIAHGAEGPSQELAAKALEGCSKRMLAKKGGPRG